MRCPRKLVVLVVHKGDVIIRRHSSSVLKQRGGGVLSLWGYLREKEEEDTDTREENVVVKLTRDIDFY
jgi:hypothetical protein